MLLKKDKEGASADTDDPCELLEKLKEEKTSRELDPEAQRKANLEEKRKALAIKREQMRNK